MKDPNADFKKFMVQTIAQSEQRVTADFKKFIAQSEQQVTADLKKFVNQTVTQAILESEGRLRKDFRTAITDSEESLDKKFSKKYDNLQTEMHAGFAAMDEAFDNLARIRDQDMKYIDKTFSRHEREISLLQEQVAPLVSLQG